MESLDKMAEILLNAVKRTEKDTRDETLHRFVLRTDYEHILVVTKKTAREIEGDSFVKLRPAKAQ